MFVLIYRTKGIRRIYWLKREFKALHIIDISVKVNVFKKIIHTCNYLHL